MCTGRIVWPDDPDQLIVQRVQVHLVAQADREGIEDLSGVLPAARSKIRRLLAETCSGSKSKTGGQ